MNNDTSKAIARLASNPAALLAALEDTTPPAIEKTAEPGRIARADIIKDFSSDEFMVLAYDENDERIPAADYYTDDREDAEATRAEMLN